MKAVAIILTVLAVGAVIDLAQGTSLTPILNLLTILAALAAWATYWTQREKGTQIRETPPPK